MHYPAIQLLSLYQYGNIKRHKLSAETKNSKEIAIIRSAEHLRQIPHPNVSSASVAEDLILPFFKHYLSPRHNFRIVF